MTAKLFKTLRDGDVDELQQLIEKGANVNEADKKGRTPLIECAIQGFVEGISVLLAAGAKSSAKDNKDGRTALIVAAVEGQAECVTELLKDPHISEVINLQDAQGMTALHWALKLQQDDVATQLIEHSGIKLNVVAKDGYTPLMYAVQNGNEELVQILLKNTGTKSTLNATDKSGNTLVHLAALLGQTNILKSLLASLPSSSSLLSSPNANGETPLHLAAAENNVEVVKWLIAQGANVKALTKDGLTPYQVSDPDSQSAEAISQLTGETPSIIKEEENEEITSEKSESTAKKEEAKSGVRKRAKLPAAAISGKKGKNNEENGNPLIARILLVIIVGSALTYAISLLMN